jgi:hypothetical protein
MENKVRVVKVLKDLLNIPLLPAINMVDAYEKDSTSMPQNDRDYVEKAIKLAAKDEQSAQQSIQNGTYDTSKTYHYKITFKTNIPLSQSERNQIEDFFIDSFDFENIFIDESEV